jgi:uncharacterized protein (TIGR00730 family)
VSVLGPERRGVVVATRDPKLASTDRLTLEAAGIRAATLAELGLRASDDRGLEEEAARWAVVTRRSTVAREGQRLVVGRPDGRIAVSEPPTLSSDMVLGLAPPPPRVTVFGGAWTREDEPDYMDAVAFGRRMAEARVQVMCGGYAGVMEAVSRGAAEADGVALGVAIEEWEGRVVPNRWLTHRVEARDLLARYPLILDADLWVAFPGGVGTLAEVAVAWNLMQLSIPPRPLLVVGERWGRLLEALRGDLIITREEDLDLIRLATAEEATEEAAALGGGGRGVA